MTANPPARVPSTPNAPIRLVLSLVIAGAPLLSACAPSPPVYPPTGMVYPTGQPGRPMLRAGDPVPAPPPDVSGLPATPAADDPAHQQQTAQNLGPGFEHDLLVGAGGYLAGRLAQKPPVANPSVVTSSVEIIQTDIATASAPVAALKIEPGIGAVSTAARAGQTTATDRALISGIGRGALSTSTGEIGLGIAEIGAGEAGGAALTAGTAEFWVPAILVIGGGYLAYRWWSSHQHDSQCVEGARACRK
jgi:hypothetical protein